jgi:hypothetical protein
MASDHSPGRLDGDQPTLTSTWSVLSERYGFHARLSEVSTPDRTGRWEARAGPRCGTTCAARSARSAPRS